jgi:hypothetical protein
MITKLLSKSGIDEDLEDEIDFSIKEESKVKTGKPLIEVIGSEEFVNGEEEEKKESQSLESPLGLLNYGFNNKYNDVFTNKEVNY